ncbi:hypothetical protein GCM10010334_38620 [Streptomyces finlayi]|uniref:Uncharacterized protein n=1 Tax=Streptomyces finlayi TaxID=67296 RepID=A0A919CB06_9ACTN|nr:hypothetical protein GCM10010334_38620 [Streptomyces finlayi]
MSLWAGSGRGRPLARPFRPRGAAPPPKGTRVVEGAAPPPKGARGKGRAAPPQGARETDVLVLGAGSGTAWAA